VKKSDDSPAIVAEFDEVLKVAQFRPQVGVYGQLGHVDVLFWIAS
jgi:hypothetical protein